MTCARHGWTDSSDAAPSCAPDTSNVADAEQVGRLLHSGNSTSPKEWLKRDELFGRKNAETVNVCNHVEGSPGASLFRSDDLSEDEVRNRSKEYAERKEGRDPRGAVTGRTHDLRAIRSKKQPEAQVVFVYDDPTKDDRRHCVVRIDQACRTEGDYLRGEVLKALGKRIEQTIVS